MGAGSVKERRKPDSGLSSVWKTPVTVAIRISRFFAPGSGVDEDPVTGSAHTALGPYWAAKLGKSDLTGYQASARGGVVRVRLNGDRMVIGGHAVTIMQAMLLA